MIRALVDFALNNKFVVLAIAVLLLGWGAISFHNLPVEAYPDIADNYVTVITQWAGRSAEEVEQQVTIPIEIQMAGMPHMTFLRSESIFGLSFVIMIFDDTSVNDWNRQKVLERLTQVNLPNGQNLQPQIGTDWSTTGQIYWYTLRSSNPQYDLMELRSLEDWVLLKQFKSVPNVVDVSDFGGTVREYQVRVDPNKLVSYGLSIGQVEQQLANNNINAGGSFVEEGMQQMNVRALGLFNNVHDIEQTMLKDPDRHGASGQRHRAGGAGPQDPPGPHGQGQPHGRRAHHRRAGRHSGRRADAQGRRGGTHTRGDSQESLRPQPRHPASRRGGGAHVGSHRSAAFHSAHGDAQPDRGHDPGQRHPLPVSAQCPGRAHRRADHSVLAAVRLHLAGPGPHSGQSSVPGRAGFRNGGGWRGGHGGEHHPASEQRPQHGNGPPKTTAEIIREACHEVQRPVFYAIAIIITAYLPIFTLQRVEGRLFRPMAWTVALALLGAMTFSILIAPVLAATFFRKGVRERHNVVLEFLVEQYRKRLALGRSASLGCGVRCS
jgi:heavy metal efflux system protein